MAQITLAGADTSVAYEDASGNPVFAVLNVGSGSTAFTVLVINGTATSYYLWVDSTGDLRISTTVPTVATIASAGTVVGAMS